MQKFMSIGFENMSLQISKIPTPTTGKSVKFQQDSPVESAKVDEVCFTKILNLCII